jgi:hypothetical protein
MKREMSIAVLLLAFGIFVGFKAVRFSTKLYAMAKEESVDTTHLSRDAEPASSFERLLGMESQFRSASSLEERARLVAKMKRHGFEAGYALSEWAESDPESYINAAARGEINDDRLMTAFEALWKKNPALAEKMASEYPDSYKRGNALGIIVQKGIFGGDAAEGERLITTYSSYLGEHFYSTYPVTPAAAYAAAMRKLPDTRHNAEIAQRYAITWYAKDPEAAKNWVKSLPAGELRDMTLGYLVGDLARETPEAAAKLYAEMRQQFPEWKAFPETLVAINKHLFADDIPGGIKWVNENLPVDARLQYFEDVAKESFEKGGAEAALEILSLVPPGQRLSLVKQIASKLGGTDAVAGLQWAATLNEQQSAKAKGWIAEGWANGNWEDTRAYLADSNNEPFPELAREVAKNWAGTDPKAAIAWAQEAGSGALSAALSVWSRNQPQAAAEYVLTLPQGEQRERFVSDVGRKLVYADMAAAEVWLNSLTTASDKKAAGYIFADQAIDKAVRERWKVILAE